MRRRGSIALAVLMTAALAGTAGADQWEKTFTVSGKPDFRVDTDDGRVRIETGPPGRISVRIETVGWEIGPGGVRISSSQNGNHVEVSARGPHIQWSFGWERRSITVTAIVPPEADLTVRTGDGDVTIAPRRGRVEVETGDGDVTIQGLTGRARLHTGDGRIEARDMVGALSAESGDGEVRVQGRFEDLDLNTGDGDIEVDVTPGAAATSDWRLTTGDGSLVLSLPKNFRANLDAHTGDGGIHVDLPVTVDGTFSHTRLRGALNGGGPTLTLRTGDGPIRIETSD